MIRALIVDDEPHAREELAALLEETGEFAIVGTCANAVEAIRAVQRERPDVLFLDIRMPVLGGFELLAMIDPDLMPHVVFVTAYDEYALRAFEEKSVDYLLKPVSFDRLQKTVAKLKSALLAPPPTAPDLPPLPRIPCLRANRIKLIDVAEVEFVCSDQSGVHVVTSQGKFFTDLTLRVLESRFGLVQCHKQFLVNLSRIDEILLLDNGLAEIRTRAACLLPVSRRYLKNLKDHLPF